MSTDNEELRKEITNLKEIIQTKDAEIDTLKRQLEGLSVKIFADQEPTRPVSEISDLTKEDILRYSRQIILPEFRVKGQKNLKNSSALVVGSGGLGCPAAVYLAAAGVGKLGLVDFDSVEMSNLHRQVGHIQARLGVEKAKSLAVSCSALNPSIKVVPFHFALDSSNSLDLISAFDLVLDCTDNVATRYLLNDACLLAGKPLVSGSALRWEGQLTVYNYQGTGPTYRCLYPTPPPPTAVTNCSDGGVMGAVPGVIGCLQALEGIKILSGLQPSYSGSLLLFDGLEGSSRVVKLRPRRKEATESVTHLVDYVQFCGAAATDKDAAGLNILDREKDRISVEQLSNLTSEKASKFLLVDVRTEPEVEMCALPQTVNIPLATLQSPESLCREKGWWEVVEAAQGQQVVVVCRRGNDSQLAVRMLRKLFPDRQVRDVVGGLTAWAKNVDSDFPIY